MLNQQLDALLDFRVLSFELGEMQPLPPCGSGLKGWSSVIVIED